MPWAYNSCIVSPLSYSNLQFHYWWHLHHLLVRYHSENTQHTTHITLHATKAERMLWASLLCSEVFLVDQLSVQNEFWGFWSMSQPPSEGIDCMSVICTLKIQNRWDGEGNYCCEGGNTFVSSILPMPFVFALKHLASQKFNEDKEVKIKVTTWLRAPAAEFYDIGTLRLVPRLNKCLDKDGNYVEK